jgi:hypothetical protein
LTLNTDSQSFALACGHVPLNSNMEAPSPAPRSPGAAGHVDTAASNNAGELSAKTMAVPPPTNPKPSVGATGVKPLLKLVASESARTMTGLKPHAPMRKRGMSFKETRRISIKVDENGFRHLNQ